MGVGVKRSTATVDSDSKEAQVASQGLVLSSCPGGSGPTSNIDRRPFDICSDECVGLDPDIPDHLGHISEEPSPGQGPLVISGP